MGDTRCTKEGDKQKDIYVTEETKTEAERGKRRKTVASHENCAMFCAYRKQEEKLTAFEMKTEQRLCHTKTRPEKTCCTLSTVMKLYLFSTTIFYKV